MTDQLTARQLIMEYRKNISVEDSTKQDYFDCLQLLYASPLDEVFYAIDKESHWLIMYCLNYDAPILTSK